MVVKCRYCGKEHDIKMIDQIKTFPKIMIKGETFRFCHSGCRSNFEELLVAETYNGHKIYRIEENKYVSYLQSPYYFNSIEDCRRDIDLRKKKPGAVVM